ncbi:MAG: DUF4838 domain-containing protein [Armatimonadota bacterium]
MPGIKHRSVILTLQDLTEPRWVPAMAGAGLNTLMLHAVRLPQDINHLINHRSSDVGRKLLEQCRQNGIAVEYQMHTAAWLVPRMLFRGSPEMFRMDVRGERTSDCNFCVSSEAAWRVFDARAQALACALPSDTGRYLWFADDVREGACHCPECAHLTASDQALMYANRMLRALRKVHPEARVSYLAYHATLAPPEAVEPAEGIFLEFAPIRRCYRHAIDDPKCAVNRTQVAALRSNLEFFRDAPLHITDYWLDASRHSGWRRPAKKIPVPVDIIRRDIAFYAEMGATSIASYAVLCDEEYWEHFGEPPVREYGAALR